MNLEVPKGAKAFQMVYFVEKAGKLQAVKPTKKRKGKILGFAFTAEEMSEKELIELVNDDFDPEVLPWVETRRDENGYILSWEEVFDEE